MVALFAIIAHSMVLGEKVGLPPIAIDDQAVPPSRIMDKAVL